MPFFVVWSQVVLITFRQHLTIPVDKGVDALRIN